MIGTGRTRGAVHQAGRATISEATLDRRSARPADSGLIIALSTILPNLRRGLNEQSGAEIAGLLQRHLRVDAAAVLNGETVVAYLGEGSDHHGQGRPYRMLVTGRALASRDLVVARGARAVGCAVATCTLTSGVAAPIIVAGEVAGAIVLLNSARHPMSGSARRAAQAVARFVGQYLEHVPEGDRTS